MSLRRSFAFLLLVATAAAHAQRSPYAPGTGDPTERAVPWKFIEQGSAAPKTPVVVYWLPATDKETNESPLLTSRVLFDGASRCVSFVIVQPKDAATIARLGAVGKQPTAVLTDGTGKVTRSVANVHGVLPPVAVEHAVRDELNGRDEAMYRDMTEGRRLAATDKSAAIALYRKVWDDRCLYPMAGTEAQHALKGLGVTVVEPPSTLLPDPNLKPSVPVTKTR